MQAVAEERAQVANANYIAARRWEAAVESRGLFAQVSYLSGSWTFICSRLPRFRHEVLTFAGVKRSRRDAIGAAAERATDSCS